MHANFLTHLDDVPRRSRAGSATRASIRCAVLKESRPIAQRIDAESRCLLDPTLLEGASIEAIDASDERIVIDLSLQATTEESDGPHPWGGPMRLIAEGHAGLACSDPETHQPDPNDPIVWSELCIRSLLPEHGVEFILVCASDRRWLIRCASIRFATLPIPS